MRFYFIFLIKILMKITTITITIVIIIPFFLNDIIDIRLLLVIIKEPIAVVFLHISTSAR